jgi:hypothetical protein
MGDEEEGESEESEEGERKNLKKNLLKKKKKGKNIGNVNGHAGAQGARRNGSSHLGFGKSSMDGEKVNENKIKWYKINKYNL